ncbi:LIC_10190 family membrane protein [Spirosoma daeguense]
MLAQLFSFLLCSSCFLLLGALTKKLTNWSISYYYDFLLGFCISNSIFTFISIFYPINNLVTSTYLVVLTLLSILNKNWLISYGKAIYKKLAIELVDQPIISGITLLFIGITYFQSLYPPTLHYDAALYHIPNIKWISEYATIRGLANLNIVFGYNFNIFPLYAAFSFRNLFGQNIYSINLIITCVFLVWIFSNIKKAIVNTNHLLGISYLLVLYYLIVNYWIHVSTPSNDIVVFILVIILLHSIADINVNKDAIFPIFILSFYSITVKLSAGPILLLACYVAFLRYFWSSGLRLATTLILSSFTLTPWLFKNAIISGWLLFPFPNMDLFSVDWKVPITDVITRKELIKGFYMPNRGNIEGNWLHTWLFSQDKIDLFTISFTATVIFIVILKAIRNKKNIFLYDNVAIFISIVGIIYMFLNSPSLRYCVAFFLIAIIFSIRVINNKSSVSKYLFYSLSSLLVIFFLKDNWFHPLHFFKNISNRAVVPYSHVNLDSKEFAYFLIDNKVKCYYPIGSDQCYDQNLPCASIKLEGLHLRGKTIQQGFYKSLVSDLK